MLKSMPESRLRRWPRAAAIGTIGVLSGFMAQMAPLSVHSLRAAEASASSAATATASASSSSRGRCSSETSAAAETTTVVDGERRTMREHATDRSDACGRPASSEAEASVDDGKPEDGAQSQ